MFNVFVLALLFIVLSVCNLNNEVALCCVCVVCFLFFVNKTKWFSGLHLVILFVFWLFCVHFSFLSKKAPENPDTSENQKQTKMQKKRTNKQFS